MSANQTGTETARSRRRSGWFAYVLIPAAIMAGYIVLLGIISRPPPYLAQAAFVVDWNRMPSVPGDETADKVRAQWREEIRAEIESLPGSETISDFIDQNAADAESTWKTTATTKARNWLRITRVPQTNDCDRFVIEMWDADPQLAQVVANCVLLGSVSKYNADALIGRLMAAARAGSNLDAIDKRETEMRKAGSSDSFLQELERDLQRAEAQLGLIGNLFGVFESPVSVAEQPHVELHSGVRWRRVLLSASFLGGIVGLLALGLRFFVRIGLSASPRQTIPSPVLPPVVAPPIVGGPSQPPVWPPPMPRA